MNNFTVVQNKLEAFIKRFYINELLKGFILFFAIGLLYFLFTLFIESLLWLDTTARTVLFWLFILVELGLLVTFIFVPLAKLFRLQKGIDFEAASKIIGQYFPEVSDKLLNVLQLHEKEQESELLLASIEQKSSELTPVPFKLAINFNKNRKYLKYAAIPVLILLVVYVTGNSSWFSDSYKRVVDYKTAYEPPAPFQFFVVNNDLKAIENNDFRLHVKTAGEIMPDNVEITYNDEIYFLQPKGRGEFEYVFTQLKEDITFRLQANGVNSRSYEIEVVETPSLLDFEMILDYPNYTKRKDETLKSTGNALVPEGTQLKWILHTKSTKEVWLYAKDTLMFKEIAQGQFEVEKSVFNNYNYTISTSNDFLKDYENLAFSIDVVKDEYPDIDLKVVKDSTDLQTLYFYGQISDDYGFSKLQLVYYPSEEENKPEYRALSIPNANVGDFISAFPNNLDVKEGVSYDLYFEVYDNDRVNRFKKKKSSTFTYRKRTREEEEERNLHEQSKAIKDLDKSLEKIAEQDKRLEELSKTQKEKSHLNFNDKKKLESFLNRQKQQDEMMKNFNKKLKENLEDFQKDNPKNDEFKEALKERLKENEEKLEKDERLLEEIEKLQEKISKEDLIKKLDELAKQNKNKKRSLEQLLELTKRFYVEKKLEKLRDDLEKLAEEQNILSEKSLEENTKEKQDELNDKFEEYKKQLNELQQESEKLKKPIDIPRDEFEEKEVEDEQTKASDELEKNEDKSDEGNEEKTNQEKQQNLNKAKKSQKKAAVKMKKMSRQMQSAMQASGGESMEEDAETLRQILDNLVLFSFDEEALMNQFKAIETDNSQFANYLRKQNSLREHFEHVDDSLFALSLRQPKLSEKVNNEITEVYYNIDKALELLAENRLYQGVSNQQFAVTAANTLADMLSDVLDNMQESLSMSPGQGDGDMQLPDIIMSQEQLNKMMQKGMQQGQGKEGQQQGEGQQEGQGKQEGKKGKDGKSGENGESGKGKSGKGKSGKGKKGNESGGEGEGPSEGDNELLYEIYQRQQQLRQALEDRLAKDGKTPYGNALVRRMENIEVELLNRGLTQQTLQKMMNLEHQLLKLENATFQQGEDNKRESETNKNAFNSAANNSFPKAKEYFNTTDILNRQAIPLQEVYKKKVKEYFKEGDD